MNDEVKSEVKGKEKRGRGMKITPALRGFATSEARIFIKAVCTFLVEQKLAKARILDIAYALDPTLANDPVYGREVDGGKNRLHMRFDRWKYEGSKQEGYLSLPHGGPLYVSEGVGKDMLELPLDELPQPVGAEELKAFFDSMKPEKKKAA